jgi:hypothetical protein
MKCLAIAMMFAASAVTAATAEESCKDQAPENKFTGETLKNFMTNCKDLATMVCEGQAIDQRLSDEAKDTFTPKSASRTRLAACESVGLGRAPFVF